MEVISNLEDVKNLEFDSNYITDLIEKFSITPILCNKQACQRATKSGQNYESVHLAQKL